MAQVDGVHAFLCQAGGEHRRGRADAHEHVPDGVPISSRIRSISA
jgi:hypothetical protein